MCGLQVVFEGEEGMDDGGIKKEYFMLLIKELLNPMFGMFYEDEESHLIWFRDQVISPLTLSLIISLSHSLSLFIALSTS